MLRYSLARSELPCFFAIASRRSRATTVGRIDLIQPFQRPPLPVEIARNAASHAVSLSIWAGLKSSAGRWPSDLAHVGEAMGRHRPIKPGAPDGDIVGTPL